MAMNLIIFQSTILPHVFCYNSILVLLMTQTLSHDYEFNYYSLIGMHIM